jgi:cytochrome c-type biogenesis protein CcmH
MERYADAGEAYRNLMRLQPEDADGFAGFGEMSTAANGGMVTPEAHAAFVQALKLEHDEPRGQFYLGLEKAQTGDAEAAIAIWRALTASAPQDASWLPMVRGQMAQVAQAANVMPMSVTPRYALDAVGTADAPTQAAAPSTPEDPSTPDVGAIEGRFSPENLQMIQGMVGGLAARLKDNPNDYDGWMMLGRSYTVLNNAAGAKDAYIHAAKLKPTEAMPKMQLAEVLLHEGEARAAAGDTKGARKLWQEAIAPLPAGAPLRDQIAQRLNALK